jgi:hypothetical protein
MVSEDQILKWQESPDESLLELIRSGDVLLLSKDRQQKITARILGLYEASTGAVADLERVNGKYAILIKAMTSLMAACKGMVIQAPAAIALFESLQITDKKGSINWMTLVGIALGFTRGSEQSRSIQHTIVSLKNGFNQEDFASINFPEILEIIKEQDGSDLSEYEEAIATITQSFYLKNGQ